MSIDDLLAGITPEHNIPDDFIEAVRASHTEGLDALRGELSVANDSALAALTSAHADEIARIRAEKFEEVLDPGDDNKIDSVGDSTIDNLTIETYWEEAK